MELCIKDILTKDNIQIFAHLALVGILALNLWNFSLQNKSLQLNLFGHITQGLQRVEEAITTVDTEQRRDVLAAQMVWTYDSFAFFANHKYLDRHIIDYFQPMIIADCNHIRETHPKVFRTAGPTLFRELKKLYKNETGEQLSPANNP